MLKLRRHILLVILLHLSVAALGQYDEELTDSVVALPPPVQDYSSFKLYPESQPVAVRKVAPEKLHELKEDDAYWYANFVQEKKKKEEQPSGKGLLDAAWFQNLLWIIILCSFIGVVIWYLASSNINLFQKQSKKIQEEEEGEDLPEDIFSIHYEREIQKAADAGNYRLAVRLWYLKTLKDLADRNIIDYRHERTDSEYVNSLYGTRYYRDFFRLTRNFEYTWYGQFHLSAEAYDMMRADFTHFKNSLS